MLIQDHLDQMQSDYQKVQSKQWKTSNNHKGLYTELCCIRYLQEHQYSILYHRFKKPTGEIDIVARTHHVLYIFEVKYREESVDAARLSVSQSYKRMYNTYLTYLYDIYPNLEPRFKYFAMSKNEVVIGDIDHDADLNINEYQY